MRFMASAVEMSKCQGISCQYMYNIGLEMAKVENKGVIKRILVPTAGFYQLSMRCTRGSSVKFNATPPAFKLTKNTVTPTLFTEKALNGSRQIDIQLCCCLERVQKTRSYYRCTEALNGATASLGGHGSLKSTDLSRTSDRCQHSSRITEATLTEKPAFCSLIKSKKLRN